MYLTLAWWNTGLSPTKRLDRAKATEIQAASKVVTYLMKDVSVDFLALGEVSIGDIEALQTLAGETLKDFSFVPTQEKIGRSQFDTGLIHHRRLLVTSRESVVRRMLDRSTRVAQRFDVEIPGGDVMRTYVCHWPSRARMGVNDSERMRLGSQLRDSVDLILEEVPDTPLILLGDFNDEPFDPVMENGLISSRDKTLVSKRPRLLYNPFWRHMSCYEHTDAAHQFSDRGTYFHAGGQLTQWRTFDQMIFSASLVTGKSGWLLDEHATRVVDVPGLAALISDRSNVFDHMPIVGRLLRNPSQ